MKRKAKIQICHNTRGPQRYWYRLLGANGEIMVVSEKFSSRADADRRARRFLLVMQGVCMTDIEDAD